MKEEEEFTFEFEDIPKEKYETLQSLLHEYMDGKISRESYLNKVKELLNKNKKTKLLTPEDRLIKKRLGGKYRYNQKMSENQKQWKKKLDDL